MKKWGEVLKGVSSGRKEQAKKKIHYKDTCGSVGKAFLITN